MAGTEIKEAIAEAAEPFDVAGELLGITKENKTVEALLDWIHKNSLAHKTHYDWDSADEDIIENLRRAVVIEGDAEVNAYNHFCKIWGTCMGIDLSLLDDWMQQKLGRGELREKVETAAKQLRKELKLDVWGDDDVPAQAAYLVGDTKKLGLSGDHGAPKLLDEEEEIGDGTACNLNDLYGLIYPQSTLMQPKGWYSFWLPGLKFKALEAVYSNLKWEKLTGPQVTAVETTFHPQVTVVEHFFHPPI